jgi:hypothetical protein
MTKAFSFSLYDCGNYWGGNRNKYTYNCVANVLIADKLFPDWKIYVYYDTTIPLNIINFLKKSKNVVAFDMSEHWLTTCDKMMWRNLAIDDTSLDVVCIRDCDTWLSYREKLLMDEWLASNKDLHIIRDHCYHSKHIMGGMWGVKNHLIKNIEETMKHYFSNKQNYRSHSGDDQDFLKDNYYNKIDNNKILVHIGHQFNNKGELIFRTGGYFPNEKNIKMIPTIINSQQLVNGEAPSGCYLDRTFDEVIEGLSFLEMSMLNHFHCQHCKMFHVYIGAMFNNFPERVIKVIEKAINEKAFESI